MRTLDCRQEADTLRHQVWFHFRPVADLREVGFLRLANFLWTKSMKACAARRSPAFRRPSSGECGPAQDRPLHQFANHEFGGDADLIRLGLAVVEADPGPILRDQVA